MIQFFFLLLSFLASRRTMARALRLCGALLCASGVGAQNIPWHLGALEGQLSAPSAINTVREKPGPTRIVVAVIDSGVMAGHPSLAGQLLPGYDMISAAQNLRQQRSTDYSPDERGAQCGSRLMANSFRTHGTEVASLVAGNGVDGVFGVNPQAKILPIRVFGACAMSRKDLMDAIAWAAGLAVAGLPDNPNPAKIINLSMAGGFAVCGADLQALIDRLVQAQIFIVAAAGNNFRKPLQEPANCSGVISVGALNAENRIEIYSALDPRTFVYAPGGGAPLAVNADWAVNKLKVATYELDFLGRERATTKFSGVGTSYSAPVVAGFISLWLSHHPDKTVADFLREKPQFMRQVEPLAQCATCVPMGLVNTYHWSEP
jgi:serine protease